MYVINRETESPKQLKDKVMTEEELLKQDMLVCGHAVKDSEGKRVDPRLCIFYQNEGVSFVKILKEIPLTGKELEVR